jgi:peptidyl-prolyl cis-trans isomerase-like 4
VILDDPYDDPKNLEVPPCSPEPTQEMLDSGRIGADEEVDDQEGKTLEEIDEIIQEKEAKARATILEMVGDLPDADIAPPENVLFVCKLNPVTTDEDLEIIFSRFGKIVSCEVIRDQKSGESLQYAFIEFQDRKACEDAYFKMDNVLIDDRRIHVDFSQSVSQYKWKGKGRGVQVFNENDKNGKGGKQNLWTLNSKSSGPATTGSSAKKQWSRSPPRYSRGHASEQKRKKTPTPEESADDRLLRLLREDLLKGQRDKSKSKKKESSSSSSSGSSSSSSSDSDEDNGSNSKTKVKRRREKV